MDGAAPGGLTVSRRHMESAFRLLNKSFERFYEKKYEQAVELCIESLEGLLPSGGDLPSSPEQRGDLFVKTFSPVLPVSEAGPIAGVLSFFQHRREHFRAGEPPPHRDWWQFLRVSRGEAEEALRATRLALNAIEEHLSEEG